MTLKSLPVTSAELPADIEPTTKRDPLRVVAVLYDGICTFELGIVVEIFGRRRPQLDRWYAFETTSVDPSPLRADHGLSLWAPQGLDPLDAAGTVVIPGWRDIDERPPEDLLDGLRRAHAAGARLLSICSGVFVLAAAGLLDGKKATTHWAYAGRLAETFPRVQVDPEVLYVDEGSILTSAGSAAGIDCCLHLVRRDLGAAVANRVARRLVVQPHREGGQAQFIAGAVPEPDEDTGFGAALDAVRRRLDEPHTVESMARIAHMSPRTLARRFRQQLGTTPHRWLVEERLRRCQELLEHSDHDIEHIAGITGLGSAQVLRLHFRRRFATSPTAYRRSFRRD